MMTALGASESWHPGEEDGAKGDERRGLAAAGVPKFNSLTVVNTV